MELARLLSELCSYSFHGVQAGLSFIESTLQSLPSLADPVHLATDGCRVTRFRVTLVQDGVSSLDELVVQRLLAGEFLMKDLLEMNITLLVQGPVPQNNFSVKIDFKPLSAERDTFVHNNPGFFSLGTQRRENRLVCDEGKHLRHGWYHARVIL